MPYDNITSSSPRDRILQVASDLFYRQGYHATGINQIIREAAVAKASFYDHFSSKEALAVAYLEQRREQWLALLRAAAASHPEPVQSILALFDFLERWVLETDFRGCAFLNIASEFPSAANQIRETVSAHKQRQRDLMLELVKLVEPSQALAQAKADAVFLLFESALTESRTFRAVWPVHAARHSVSVLLA